MAGFERGKSQMYQYIKEIIPSGNPYAYQKLKEKYGNSSELIAELCNFIDNSSEVVVDKADAIEVLGMLDISNELSLKVINTLNNALNEATQQSKDNMHPVKIEVNKALKKLKS